MDIALWDTFFRWQVLVGAFLGAAVPILFWIFMEVYNRHKEKKENLYYLEKTLAISINSVGEVQKKIRDFTDRRLQKMIRHVEECRRVKIYSIDKTFFPLFYVHTISEDIAKTDTRCGYLDYKISRVAMLSKDFAMIVEDLRVQFMSLVERNQQIIVSGAIPPEIQCANYLRNIREFGDVVEKELFDQDVRAYLETLISSRIAVSTYRQWGAFRWGCKFSSRFRYFKNRRALKEYDDAIFERIDKYFEDLYRKEYKKVGTRPAEETKDYLEDLKRVKR